MIRILLVSDFMGRKYLTGPICYIAKKHRVDIIALLGNTGSPIIPARLGDYCGVRVIGVLGVLDEASTASTLSALGGLVECKYVDTGGFVIYGYGISGCNPVLREAMRVDILIAYNPRSSSKCCGVLWDQLNSLVESIKPRVVAIGGCLSPCREGNVVSPGSLVKGYLGILEVTREEFSFRATSIHSELEN